MVASEILRLARRGNSAVVAHTHINTHTNQIRPLHSL